VEDMALAAGLVRDAGTLAATMLADGLDVEYKTSVSDVVSAADRSAEELIVARLLRERPDDGLVGEEGSRRAGGGRTWMVDPVDGTYNFLSGVPYWCSAVGLADADGPRVGAVYYPAMDELWAGGSNDPTTRNGVPVSCLRAQPLAEICVSTYLHPAHLGDHTRHRLWQAVVSKAATVRMMGSASIDLASVAQGRLGLFLQLNLHDWDWVPGAALVQGAGGSAETVQVGPYRWHIAGNVQAVDEARAALLASGT
jgi:myo-inositol-1(or 4)-monophosphatase